MSSISFYLMSFSHFLLSLPFSLFGLTNLGKDKFKADFQPPGYVFGIVWPILMKKNIKYNIY